MKQQINWHSVLVRLMEKIKTDALQDIIIQQFFVDEKYDNGLHTLKVRLNVANRKDPDIYVSLSHEIKGMESEREEALNIACQELISRFFFVGVASRLEAVKKSHDMLVKAKEEEESAKETKEAKLEKVASQAEKKKRQSTPKVPSNNNKGK